MTSKPWMRSILLTAVAGLTLSVAACGGSGSTTASGTSSTAGGSAAETTTSSSDTSSSASASGEFGSACTAVPTSGDGSFQAMAQVPVATAASTNPVLTTLTSAVGTAGLVDTLNDTSAEYTVFAPSDDAFTALGDQLNTVVADVPLLTDILTYHVLPMRLSPDQLAGTFTTVEGKDLTISGSGESFTVGDAGAKVVCGNVQTANATVYIIDQVLMPPA